MKTVTILTLMFFAIGAASQDVVKSPIHQQCTFSDGNTIVVGYSPVHGRFRLTTKGPLLTTHGITVPAGDYDAYLEKDSHEHRTLRMTKPFGRKGLFVVLAPMSVTTSALPVETSEVSFDQTGGSCMMHWSRQRSATVLSLEFTEKNADMPVLQ